MSAGKKFLVIGGDAGLWRAELPSVGGTVPPVRAFTRRAGGWEASMTPVLEGLPKGSTVWVWLADAWCQTLSVAAGPAGEGEAARAARWAYEAEAFSGLSPSNSFTTGMAGAAGPDGSCWCRILQVPKREAEGVRLAAAAAGARVEGISHPAFLAPVADADGEAAPEPGPFRPEDAGALAAEWAARLAKGQLPPFIRLSAPEGKWAGARRRIGWWGAAVLAAVAIAGASFSWLAGTERAEVGRLEAATGALSRENGRALAARRGMEADEAASAARLAPRRALRERQGRAAAVYGAAEAAAGASGAMVRRVRAVGEGYEVTVWCGTTGGADEFLSRLSRELEGSGLRAGRGGMKGLQVLDNGGPWECAIAVKAGEEAEK
jgi:hypothetical protein